MLFATKTRSRKQSWLIQSLTVLQSTPWLVPHILSRRTLLSTIVLVQCHFKFQGQCGTAFCSEQFRCVLCRFVKLTIFCQWNARLHCTATRADIVVRHTKPSEMTSSTPRSSKVRTFQNGLIRTGSYHLHHVFLTVAVRHLDQLP